MASFSDYMESQPRKKLSLASNDGTSTGPYGLNSNDDGNWTGCSVGSGLLVGTFRDWSACAEYDYRLKNGLSTYFTEQDLRNISYNDLLQRLQPIWNSIGAGQLSSQDVANIYMHNKLHFGNVKQTQKALNLLGENLAVDGIAGPLTKGALIRQTSISAKNTFNAIRNELKSVYEQYPQYSGWLNDLNLYFPEKKNQSPILGLLLGVGVLAYIMKRK